LRVVRRDLQANGESGGEALSEMGDRAGEDQLAGFARGRHAAYLQAMALELPRDYANQEVMHLTLAYFAVAGLSLLRALDWVSRDLLRYFPLSARANCAGIAGESLVICHVQAWISRVPIAWALSRSFAK
jgi:hypothetical protein